jgi:DNA transformation protein
MKDEHEKIVDELSGILNLGPVTASMLAENGFKSLKDLKEFGAVNTYNLLKSRGYRLSKVALYAFEGAITGKHWNKLPQHSKDQLTEELGTSSN